MEQTVLVSIAIFLLCQGGCLIWILSDLATRTKLTAQNVTEMSNRIAGFADKYITERELRPELTTMKDSINAAHKRLDGADHNNCKNYEHK